MASFGEPDNITEEPTNLIVRGTFHFAERLRDTRINIAFRRMFENEIVHFAKIIQKTFYEYHNRLKVN